MTAKNAKKPAHTSKRFGKKFKGSVGDVSTDPAYVCPFCGSRDCEFEDCPDPGTQDGYFDCAKFNATWHCKQCGRHYNVEFTMNVTDVTPMSNEMDEDGAAESIRYVYTLEVNYLDENDEPHALEAMKYAKIYYSANGALNAAKEAYLEYSKAFDEPIEVHVMGGEYETDGGNIYGEPVLLEVVSADNMEDVSRKGVAR